MNNTSEMESWVGTPAQRDAYYFASSVFLVEGIVMGATNSLLLFIVFWSELSKHKEFLLISTLAVADLLYGLGHVIGGARRLVLLFENTAFKLVTPWDCQLVLSTPLFALGKQVVGLMSLILSLDRYLFVSNPIYYHNRTLSYAKKIVFMVLGFAVTTVGIQYASSYWLTQRLPDKYNVCLSTWGPPTWYATFSNAFPAICGYLSALIYIVVLAKQKRSLAPSVFDQANRRSAAALQNGWMGHSAALAKKQQKLTQTLGVIVLFTFLLVCLPMTGVALMAWTGYKVVEPVILWMIVPLNSIISLFVYLFGQRDVRKAFLQLLRFKLFNH